MGRMRTRAGLVLFAIFPAGALVFLALSVQVHHLFWIGAVIWTAACGSYASWFRCPNCRAVVGPFNRAANYDNFLGWGILPPKKCPHCKGEL